MTAKITRREFVGAMGMTVTGAPLLAATELFAETLSERQIGPFRSPYKYGKLVLAASPVPGAFDGKAVDDPFVFYHEGKFKMLYIGFDGTGYQTGLATSTDLVKWERVACVAHRDPASKYTKYNVALSCIVREDGLTSQGRLKKIHGRYLGAWNAYPNAGYEEGAAVIGLAWSDDLLHWELTEPILLPEDGAPWEHGGLYRPNLVEQNGTLYLYYNAKTTGTPWFEQTGLATSKDLKTWTRHPGNPLIRNGPNGTPDARFASDPVVVKHRGEWGMFYFGRANDGPCRELLALGHSPTRFEKVDEVLIDIGAPGSIDEKFAHKPAVIYHDGALYHFYCAVSGKWPNDTRGLAVARSKPW